MELGAIFPTTEIGNDPVAIRDWAQAAEQLGFNHIVVYDHVLGAVHAGREPPLHRLVVRRGRRCGGTVERRRIVTR